MPHDVKLLRISGVPAKDTCPAFYTPGTAGFVEFYSFTTLKEIPLFSFYALFISSFTAYCAEHCLTDMTA